MKAIFAVIVAASLLGPVRRSEAEPNSDSVRAIFVQIEATDDEISTLVHSYVGRELRSLKDVTVTTKAGAPTFATAEKQGLVFVIHCASAPVEVNNANVGCAVSLMVTSNREPLKYIAGNVPINEALKHSPEGGLDQLLAGLCALTQTFEEQVVFTCSRKDLKENCESFVATFDTKHLNPLRGGGD